MIDLPGLLERTSRTFALSIPRLPEPTRLAVTLAYLLFRIADTFEDAASWAAADRVEALVDFMALLDQQNQSPDARPPARAGDVTRHWSALRPSEHQGYLDLVAATPEVLAAVAGLPPASRAVVLRHASRTAEGMRRFIENSGGDDDSTLSLASLEELRDYCYVVAGIVGELLTDLFLLDAPALQPSAHALQSRARDFGEGLQLVNILKDASDDAREGRTYLPPDTDRAEVIALARADLASASEYVLTLQRGGGPRGFVEFTALPVLLARETLDLLEREGPGAKLPRERVMALAAELDRRLDAGEAALGPS